jgi:uncharacterized protein YndB with AHSA1/START domain
MMDKKALIPDISDDAVRKATGRTWNEWKIWLDDRGAADLSHKEIVALLADGPAVASAWWQQSVTNGYEKLIGRRALGETQDAAFQIGLQKTLDAPAEEVWRMVTSQRGIAIWLGEGAPRALSKGKTFALEDGATGEVRTVEPGSHLRVTWHPGDWPRASTIQLRVTSKGPAKCVLGFHQEHLPDAASRETRRSWFRDAAARIEDGLRTRARKK